MSPTRKNQPKDRERSVERSQDDQAKRNVQNAGELNRNEERSSPKSNNDYSNQRNSDGKTPISERPDQAAERWDQRRNETTGSNVPGSEIADRKVQGEQWQTSQDIYPKNSKSNPVSDIHHPGQHHTGLERNRPNQMYTGNSEQSGQQYSDDRNSVQKSDRELKQSRKDHADQNAGSNLSAKRTHKSMNSADVRNQRETDEATGRREQRQKKTDQTDGGEC